MDVSALAPFSNVECPHCAAHTRVKLQFGPYTLVRRHAVGGMSMVFLAHDETLDREVALKILSEEYSADERRIVAFEEEARITASISNPNVVRVLRTGRAFGRFYIAMEFVPGGHFEHQIRERGKIPEVELLGLAIEVAQGLKAAHAAGLIHRDVKPGNILLDSEGHARLVDFGLALVTHGGKAQATELWATPYYVPPETVEGSSEDFRSDIYAFGATLYHALCGNPSCDEETMATDLLRAAKKKIIPLSVMDPSISMETCRIVGRAMAYDPSARFSSYDELIAGLTSSLNNLKSGRARFTEISANRRAKKKHWEILITVGAVIAIIFAAGVLWWVSSRKPKPVVVIQVPVVPDSAPSAVESSNIARDYRDARASIEKKEFEHAAVQFREIFNSSTVQEPTRTWAGLEAVLAHFLNGRSAEANLQGHEILNHMRSKPGGVMGNSAGLIKTLEQLGGLPPISVPNSPAGGACEVVSAMLAGLKNWEQGMTGPAASCFQAAIAVKLSSQDQWASVYQRFSADYLSDYQVICGPLFTEVPADKAGCEAAVAQLNGVLVSLKTRGRAKFNVRSWQADLSRRAKHVKVPKPSAPSPTQVLARVHAFAVDFRFKDATAYLKSQPANPGDKTRSSLLILAELSEEFLLSIEQDLAKQAASAEMELKTGEMMAKISIDSQKVITVTSADGQRRICKWGDFSPDAFIALHRVLMKNQRIEMARQVRRHECAIAFDWLTGSRERAFTAAATLSQSSEAYKKRWSEISAGLPK